MILALSLLDLLEATPLEAVANRLGFSPAVRGGHTVLGRCPFKACNLTPYGVVPLADLVDGKLVFTESEGRPRVSFYGNAWTCSACGGMGGSREFAAAALGLWTDADEPCDNELAQRGGKASVLQEVATSAMRSNRTDLGKAERQVMVWALNHAPELSIAEIDAVMHRAANNVSAAEAANG